MSKFYFYISMLALAVMAASCANNTLRPKEYVLHINNNQNGYVQQADAEGLKIECLYKPQDFEALYRLHKYDITQAQLDSVKNQLGDNSYYELKIYYDTRNNPQEKMYVDYYMENDLRVINTTGDTIKPNSYLAEPYDGISPFQRVLVSFPVQITDGELTLAILGLRDKNKENLKFNYSNGLLNRANLKIN